MLALTTAGVAVALATLWYTRKEYQLSTKGADESPNEVTKDDGEGSSSSRRSYALDSQSLGTRGEYPPRHSEKGLDSL